MAFLIIILGYFLGSIPFSYIMARLVKGIDIRSVGSGNVGGFNVMQQVGFLPGAVAGLLDVSKGVVALLLARWLGFSEWVMFLVGMAAVFGHCYPLFLGFKGGKGGSVSIAMALLLLTKESLIAILVGALVFLVTRNIAVTLGTGFAVLIPLAWWFGRPWPLVLFPLVLLLVMGMRILPDALKLFARVEHLRDIIFFEGSVLDRWRKGGEK